jgi:hypothetical protein
MTPVVEKNFLVNKRLIPEQQRNEGEDFIAGADVPGKMIEAGLDLKPPILNSR